MNREKNHRNKNRKHIWILTVTLILIAGISLFGGSKFISDQLLQANKNMAVDFALLVKNNFQITDAEVAYMKSLTFNEMEVDPINKRLMDVGNGIAFNAGIRNVYLLAELSQEDMKYIAEHDYADFFGYDEGTALDGIWLLNGKIDDNGRFEVAQREDIYRYTHLTDTQRRGLREQAAFGDYSQDAWGNFITGYAPVYTAEGHFAGLLGIDMDIDLYQTRAKRMITVLMMVFSVTLLALVVVFLYFHFQNMRLKESRLYFDFYSRMSHDMRTPMNGILGMAEISMQENDVDTLHHNFSRIRESGQYMLRLINDTLDIQTLDAGKLKLSYRAVRFGDVVQDISLMMKSSAEEKRIQLILCNHNIDMDSMLYADTLRLQQIFINLISNAIKFTPESGTIQFYMECTGTDGKISHYCFRVKDTGIGMSEEFIKQHLFQPFAQEQNSVTTQYGGPGLGLSIVKNLIDLMGGRIRVESVQGEGTTVIVSLDFEMAEVTLAISETDSGEEQKTELWNILCHKHILLCEDQPLNAEITTVLLEKHDCHVTVAQNGRDGLELFQKEEAGTFDLILMDIRMPVMDGVTATREIRALKRTDAARIPIIALTANTYAEDIQNCLDAGMNGHIAKPVDPQLMYQVIAEKLQESTQE